MSTLAAFLISVIGPLAKRLLVSLGIGVVSYAALSTLLNDLIQSTLTNYQLIDSKVLAILNLAGVGTALGIITGGLVTSLSLIMLKRFTKL